VCHALYILRTIRPRIEPDAVGCVYKVGTPIHHLLPLSPASGRHDWRFVLAEGF
jgi:hypothetical protein